MRKKQQPIHQIIIYFIVLLTIVSSQELFAQENLNCTLEGSWREGVCNSVELQDQYVFYGNGCYLEIKDVTDPANPIEISNYLTEGLIYDIEVKDTLIFLALDGIGLNIINIADIYQPKQESIYYIYGYYPKIEIQDSEIFYCTERKIHIIDFSKPDAPLKTRTLNTESYSPTQNTRVLDKYIFAARGSDGFYIFDYSNSDSLQQVYHIDNIYAYDIDIKGDYACIAASDSIVILNISSLPNVVEESVIVNIKYINFCRFYKNMIIGSGYEAIAFDISDISNPEPISSYNFDGQSHDLAIMNDHIYIASRSKGLNVLKIENNIITQVKSLPTRGSSRKIAIKDDVLYMTQVRTDILLFDISNPEAPVLFKEIPFKKNPSNIKAIGNYLYISDNGLVVYDISNPLNPVELSYLDLGVATYDFQIVDNKIFMGTWGNLVTIDISNLNDMKVINEFPMQTGDAALSVYIDEDYAYLGRRKGFSILDISNPDNYTELSNWDKDRNVEAITVLGHYAYIGNGGSRGFSIIDISDKTNPVNVNRLQTSRGYSISIIDSTAYMSSGYRGMFIYDVTDPANPQKIGYFDSPGQVFDLKVDGDLVYFADYDCGMSIVRFDRCASLSLEVSLQNILCNGSCDGSISIDNINYGSQPFTYNWSTGESANMISSLCPGDYQVTVTDKHGCVVINDFSIAQPDEILITNIEKTDITDDNPKGNINIEVTGGIKPYTYQWTGPAGYSSSNQNIDNLQTGCYKLYITDANNCTIVSDDICIEDHSTSVLDAEINDDFQVYPNPAKDYIYLKFGIKKYRLENAGIQIVTATGKKIKTEYNKSRNRINTGRLKEGIYFLLINTKEGTFGKKILILR